MVHPNEDLLRRAYEAQSAGDLDTHLGLLTDDIVFHIPGRSNIAGECRGKDEVRRHFRDLKELTGGTFRTDVHDVIADDEHAVGLIDARGSEGRHDVRHPEGARLARPGGEAR